MFESPPKWRQILRQRAINTNLGPGARRMEITAGADQQTEFTGQNGEAADLIGRLQAVDHFYGMATRLDEVGDQPATLAASEIVMRWMRQTDPGTRGPQRRDGVFKRWPVLFDITQLARTEPFSKCFGAVFHETSIDQEVREVRPGRRITAVAERLLDRASTFQRAGHTFHR
jgi:hypothetical protein